MAFEIILPVAALTISGIVWNTFGYFSAWRKNKDNPDWEGFDKKKLRDDLILGTVLGIGAVIAAPLTGTELPVITDTTSFVTAIAGGFGLIAAVDKFIVGGILGK